MNLGTTLAERGRSVVRAALQLALPQRCPGCAGAGSAERLLCAACEAAIPIVSIAVCARCLARGAEGVGCARHPGFAVWPAWSYDERATRVVHALKYEGRTGLAAARRAHRAGPAAPLAIELVIPMPLHGARRRERGYNQSERLALALSRRLGAPCVTDVLERFGPRVRRRGSNATHGAPTCATRSGCRGPNGCAIERCCWWTT